MATDKDTIYIDIDDEITGIIDKLKASDGKVVALVLPKRAGVFQSIVNMKLLKRAADGAKKNAVLITSEAGLIPLAGAAGLHVAKTLTSKPEIPVAPSMVEEAVETVNESEADGEEPVINPDQTVGELADGTPPPPDNGVETIALDDEELPPEDTPKPGPKSKSFEPPKAKKDKKLKIPNFERFRLLLILFGLLLIIVIGGFIYANASLTKATIDIKTNATNVDVNQNLGLSTSAKTASDDGSTVPAKLEEQQKTYTQQVPTTGQRNNGNKASGSVTISLANCDNDTITIPSGSGLSGSGQTYITQSDITLSSVKVGKSCNPSSFSNIWSQSVNVIAAQAGASSNLPSGTTMTVASGNGFSSKDVQASSGTISGGTDSIVQSVNQNDINNAKAKISTTNNDSMKQTLDTQTKGDGYYPLDATFSAGTPIVTSSASVGEVANTVTVTEAITYTMFGVQQNDLKSILASNIKSQIDTSKQSILDDGLSSAVYGVNTVSSTGATLTLTTKAEVGPQLDITSIKAAAAGKKSGEIQSQLTGNPDVTGVTVHYSPFWVSSVPKDTSRITVNVAKPTSTQSSKSSH